MRNEFLPTIGITIGDINGIGPEVIIKALDNSLILSHCQIIIYGSGKHLSKYKSLVGQQSWQFYTIKHAKQANSKKVNLINCYKGDHFELDIGKIKPEAGKLAFQALERAVSDLKEGFIDLLVTAPISKDNTQSDEFNFPGHTEYLTDAFNAQDSLMFMVSDDLRMGVVTGHIPVEKVKQSISKESISKKLDLMLNSLKMDFTITKPKVAVLGLNPHAGENGLLGNEEKEIIEPLVQSYRDRGELVFGPFPTDGFFGTQEWRKYDAVLAMYHDQGLTPFKMISFENGVNYTAGLPFIRTSPDHGTAFGIAGNNEADPGSMLNAIFYALDIWRRRRENEDLDHHAIQPIKIDFKNKGRGKSKPKQKMET